MFRLHKTTIIYNPRKSTLAYEYSGLYHVRAESIWLQNGLRLTVSAKVY